MPSNKRDNEAGSANNDNVSDETVQVLRALDGCEVRKVEQSSVERKAAAVADRSLATSFALLVFGAIAAASYAWISHTDILKVLALAFCSLSMLAALVSLITPIVLVALILGRWKQRALDGLCNDLRHEESLAASLEFYSEAARDNARFWLERKISRLASRTMQLFGEKTAAIALIGTCLSFVAKLGGLDWLSSAFGAGLTFGNLTNIVLLFGAAFLFGASIGAIVSGQLAARYRFQLEVLELAQRRRHAATPPVEH